jgi:hypothetical protein
MYDTLSTICLRCCYLTIHTCEENWNEPLDCWSYTHWTQMCGMHNSFPLTYRWHLLGSYFTSQVLIHIGTPVYLINSIMDLSIVCFQWDFLKMLWYSFGGLMRKKGCQNGILWNLYLAFLIVIHVLVVNLSVKVTFYLLILFATTEVNCYLCWHCLPKIILCYSIWFSMKQWCRQP